ncbi:hypothetical protein EDC40_104166 [Aminobacter aminovorans]|jgi:hypothetical protein|uniref:SnoaL-like domain-containing protein n=1 Tax=Aminobacter aminovorans TaxID=83263 RepID=A0A380WIS6_AMIAI|nr:hypothetical protein [Aminobacter aminovorans]TCS26699.1 hypothetical protein EDC40_104166 [Aminobacter aminovorans]SUU88242.1 Uncharacterised protein [Aminobacter aminovorans]
MTIAENPFPGDADRAAIWEMLVRRDIAAFVGQDWAMVSGDFDEQRFLGIHAHNSANPDAWDAAFPTLEVYRNEWLRQAAETAATCYAEPLAEGIHRATRLTEIDITGDVAVARKKFDGTIKRGDGSDDVLNWQTLYFCRKTDGRWKITGFVGYMKYI